MNFTPKIQITIGLTLPFNWLIPFIIIIVSPFISSAQSSEYMVKAAFLEKFTRFIEWPESSNMDNKTQPFVISIIGKNPFGSILTNLYSTQKINGRKVTIRNIHSIDKIEGTHILFIAKSEQKNLAKILDFAKNKPILTTGETKGYATNGVLINFYISNKKVRFEINETAVRNSGLYMNFRLLSLAKIVDPVNE